MQKESNIRTPSYYIRQRLLKNKPAMFGLVVIVLAHVIALLGYLIMPDQTPDANDGNAIMKKLKPGTTVILLKTIKNREIQKENIFYKMWFGQESEYIINPIKNYSIKGTQVVFEKYQNRTIDSSEIILLTKAISSTSDSIIPKTNSKNYFFSDGEITFLDLDNNIQKTTLPALIEEFKTNNIENRTHWLGTDKAGRDILSRLLFGTRISLGIGFVSVVIAIFVGVAFGAIGGFFGGIIDKISMWIMTVVWSIPGIMLVIAISLALHSKGIWVAFVAVGLTMWVDVARVVRGQILSIKEKLYVEAATALGIGNMRIIFRHILPNIMGPLIVITTANFASAILIEAGLSFLGMGVQPPMPSWGMMVNEGYNSNWESDGGYLVLIPSLCICLLVLAFNLFGNGLRDAYDPQSTVKW